MKPALWLVWALSTAIGLASAQPGDPELRGKLKAAIESNQTFDDPYAAEVWLTLMSQRMARFNPDPAERLQILTAVHREASRVNIAPEMVLSVMHVESLFKRFAISSAGAQGLMQIMPFWKAEIDHPEANLFDIDTNIRFGCTILRHYLDREKGNWTRALARYNGSLGKTWYPERVMAAWDRFWFPG